MPVNCGYDEVHTEFGSVQRVSVEYFMRCILPPLPERLDASAIMKTLKRGRSGRLGPLTKSGQWRGFAMRSPAQGNRTTEDAFKSFPAIVDAISRTATRRNGGNEPSQAYRQDIKEAENRSEELHLKDTLPDACIIPRHDKSTSVTLDTVCAVGWYKRYSTWETKIAVRKAMLGMCSSSNY